MAMQSFNKWAENHMAIDMINDNLVCFVPDQDGNWYKVSVDESKMVPTPTGCSCKASGSCNHIATVSRFYTRIYKSNVEKANVKITAQPVVSSTYTMSDALWTKLASLNEVKTTKTEEVKVIEVAEVIDDKTESDREIAEMALESEVAAMEAAKTSKSQQYYRSWTTRSVAKQQHYGVVKSEAAEIIEKRNGDVHGNLNGAQQTASFFSALPSRKQQKQQEALAS